MGADWYFPFVIYGHAFTLSSSYRHTLHQLHQLEEFIIPPFSIFGILSSFHSRMEFTNPSEMDDSATIVIGFTPDNDLQKTLATANELHEYITNNPIFLGFDIQPTSQFFTGIEWHPELEPSDTEDSSESEFTEATNSLVNSIELGFAEESESEDDTPSDHDDTVNYHQPSEEETNLNHSDIDEDAVPL